MAPVLGRSDLFDLSRLGNGLFPHGGIFEGLLLWTGLLLALFVGVSYLLRHWVQRPSFLTRCALMVLASALLFAVGVGEAYRTYPGFQLEKLTAQGETVKQTLETFLKAGVPLKQVVGFDSMAGPLLASDSSITGIRVIGTQGETAFYRRGQKVAQLSDQPESADEALPGAALPTSLNTAHGIVETDTQYFSVIPLNNKFEESGRLILATPKHAIVRTIDVAFGQIGRRLLAALMFFFLLLGLVLHRQPRERVLLSVQTASFAIASFIVLAGLSSVFSAGIQDKTKALSQAMSKRLQAATQLGLPLDSFSGIDTAFGEYRDLNPEIRQLFLVENGKVLLSAGDVGAVDLSKVSSRFYEYNAPLGALSQADSDARVVLRVPKSFVYRKLWRSIKNFLVLFVAAAILTALLHALLNALKNGQSRGPVASISDMSPQRRQNYLVLIKVLYFFAVFSEGLFASFLPQYLQEVASGSNLDTKMASWLFTSYFAAFALSLVPSGTYGERGGVKRLLWMGILLSSISIFLMTFSMSFFPMLGLRVMAGVGQGMLFIGVQSFILRLSSAQKTTSGISIIVFGYQTGMISGTAIGALLVVYLEARSVFLLGAVLGLAILWFIFKFIPNLHALGEPKEDKTNFLAAVRQLFRGVPVLIADFNFLKTIVLIGITAKATLSGVVVYGLPLIMAKMGYQKDDIGQILIFYGLGVLGSNIYIPKIADKVGNTGKILFWGTMGSAMGLLLISSLALPVLTQLDIPQLATGLLLAGVTGLGLAHGFIHAPIVTHVSSSAAAVTLGKATTGSVYRFLERIGHVLGPLVVGQALVWHHYTPASLLYLGLFLALCGILFALVKQRPLPPQQAYS